MTMKRLSTTTLFLLISALLLTIGCDDDDDSSSGIPAVGTVTATINGEAWEASGATAVSITANIGGVRATAITVAVARVTNTSTGDNEALEVTVYGSEADGVTTGSFDVTADQVPTAQFSLTITENNTQTQYFATSGTVTVDAVSDDNIQGTFEGTLTNLNDDTDTREVSGGGFNANISTFSF